MEGKMLFILARIIHFVLDKFPMNGDTFPVKFLILGKKGFQPSYPSI